MTRSPAALLGVVSLLACGGGAARVGSPDRQRALAPDARRVEVDATVEHVAIEGGFWAFRGDDGVTYEPTSFPPELRTNGLRVHLVADRLEGVASTHMVGPIVDVVSATPLVARP